jgi:hypothetical protein
MIRVLIALLLLCGVAPAQPLPLTDWRLQFDQAIATCPLPRAVHGQFIQLMQSLEQGAQQEKQVKLKEQQGENK